MSLARVHLMMAGATALLAVLPAAPAVAQTAGDINRLNAAIQVCNSPMGAGMAECAKLRGQVGGGLPGSGGGGGTAGALLGALGGVMNARQTSQPTPPPAPAANPQLIAECVKAAAGNTVAIQACLNTASAPRIAAAPGPLVPRLGQPLMPGGAATSNSGLAIYQGGQNYHACVAANGGAWQGCTHLLNGGQPPGR